MSFILKIVNHLNMKDANEKDIDQKKENGRGNPIANSDRKQILEISLFKCKKRKLRALTSLWKVTKTRNKTQESDDLEMNMESRAEAQ